MKLTVATCQFPISFDIRSNLRYVLRQIRAAKDQGAHVAHFPEACLSGYAGTDFPSHEDFDWDLLRECTQRVLDLARGVRMWVVLGAAHRLTAPHKPHNSLYIIDDRGKIVDRYDKMFCAGDRSEKTGDLGNGYVGVSIMGSPGNTVGGTESGAGNIISGSEEEGVLIASNLSSGNKIQGNAIRANGLGGVTIDGASDTIVGSNLIFGNGANGVSMEANNLGGRGNSILSNRIFGNAGIGIDLGPDGVSSNDTDDPDTGANNLQNFPLITSATRRGNLTTINGTLNSTPNQSFTIQCFVSGGDDSGHGEGQTFVGQDTNVQTNSAGDGSFSCTSALPQVGQVVSATATNTATGDTSEFSENVVVRFDL